MNLSATTESARDLLRRATGRKGLYADRLSSNFSEFARAAWRVVWPGRKLVWSWHYDLMCEYLTLVKQRKLLRAIFNVPPRTAKSTIVSICFPCWTWITEPEHSFLCASYSMDLSTEHNLARRNLITSPWYQSLWRDKYQLAGDRNLVSEFQNDHRGQMIATSVGARTLGKGGDTVGQGEAQPSRPLDLDVPLTGSDLGQLRHSKAATG